MAQLISYVLFISSVILLTMSVITWFSLRPANSVPSSTRLTGQNEEPDQKRSAKAATDNKADISEEQEKADTQPSVPVLASANQVAVDPALSRTVNLTFDDGPDPVYTPLILEILALNNIKSTFFIVGSKAGQNPDIVKKMMADGHSVGNHSFEHLYEITYSSDEKFRESVVMTQDVIFSITGGQPQLFRPPGGTKYYGPQKKALITELGMKNVYWNLTTGDGSLKTTPSRMIELVQSQLPNSQTGEPIVVLMHDDRPSAVAALQTIINIFKNNGFTFDVVRPEYIAS